MGDCGSCKYWGHNSPRYNVEGVKRCEKVVMEHYDYNPETKKFGTKALAYVEDGSSYYAALMTTEEFGCVLHEEE